MTTLPLPNAQQAAAAWENLANTCSLVAITSCGDVQRVSVVTFQGDVYTADDPFAARAAWWICIVLGFMQEPDDA